MNCNDLFMSDFQAQLNEQDVKIYSVENRDQVVRMYSRRDFYKITLLSGAGIIQYGQRSIQINGAVLMISKPGTVCSWRLLTSHQSSYVCVFTERFLEANCFHWVDQCKPFISGNPRVDHLNDQQNRFFVPIFQKMIIAQDSVYRFKGDLIQNQICVVLHSALRLTPSLNFSDPANSPTIPAALFVELLELQFPYQAQIVHFN